MKLPNVRYPIPPEILSVAVEGLADLARMLELQAAGLALIQTREATLRAAELMEQADAALEAAGVLGTL